MATMKAWQYSSVAGGIENNLFLPASGAPKPHIKDDQILVEVYSMALNPADYKAAELGLFAKMMVPSPCTPGMDFCGRVTETGNKIDSFRIGEMVLGVFIGTFGHGSLAQYVAVSKDMIVSMPDELKVDDAASIGAVGITAYLALKNNVKEGDKVFINGGSGGTGTCTVQMAKILGCHVTASCSTANVELCKSLGADEVLDYKSTDIIKQLQEKGQIFNLAIDNVGSPSNLYRVSHSFLVSDGKYIQVGMGLGLGAFGQLAGNMLLPGFLGGGKRKFQMVIAKPDAEALSQTVLWMKEGKLRAVIDSIFEFDDAPKAFEKLKTGRAKGKIVIHVKKE